MNNFVIQELNRGSVIYGLPDPSGKARPMVLLTDVKPNGTANYGITLNAFQIGSNCYNRFEIPIKLRGVDNRTSFLSVMHTLQFTATELFKSDIDYVGILPQTILDLACSIHAAYICGRTEELKCLEESVRKLRMEFMLATNTTHIDYRDIGGGTIRLWVGGKEERVSEGVPNYLLTNNSGDRLIGKTVQHIFGGGTSANAKPADEISKNETQEATNEDHSDTIASTVDEFGWKRNIHIYQQTNDALVNFMHGIRDFPPADLAKRCGYSSWKSVYNRRKLCVEELYRRVDANIIVLNDDDLELLLKLGGGYEKATKVTISM